MVKALLRLVLLQCMPERLERTGLHLILSHTEVT